MGMKNTPILLDLPFKLGLVDLWITDTLTCMVVNAVRSEFVTSTENARDSGQSSTNTSNTQQHSQQLSSRVAGVIHFNL